MEKDKIQYRILVLEDNLGDFILVEDFLTEEILDPVIVRAVNFKEAREIFATTDIPFDVILSDVSLPDMDGNELISEIVKLASQTPVIILTGYTDVAFSMKSISQGIFDYLLKDELNANILYKSILYSIQRRKSIAQLLESEKRYSDLFQFSPQPIWVVDLDTSRILDVNEAAIQNYNYSRDEFLAMTTNEIIVATDHPDHLDEMEKLPERYFAKNEIIIHRKKNGEKVYVDVKSNSITFDSKRAALVQATDVTDRISYIAAIEKQNEKFGEIAWIQSHVVRAPIARLMGLIDLIKHPSSDEDLKSELLSYVVESAVELDEIVRQITLKAEEIDISQVNV